MLDAMFGVPRTDGTAVPSVEPGRRNRWGRNWDWLLLPCLLAGAFAASAQLSHVLAIEPGHYLLFWPPSGLYLGLLLTQPRRRWLGLIVAAVAADLVLNMAVRDKDWRTAAGFTCANQIEVLVAALAVRYLFRDRFALNKLPQVLGLAIVTVLVAAPLGALVGAATATATLGGPFAQTWLNWWAGDALGIAMFAPALIGAAQGREAITRARLAELMAILGGSGLAAWAIFSLPMDSPVPPALLFPFIIWAAVRFGVGGVSGVLVFVGPVAAHLTAIGLGPCAHPDAPVSRAFLLQVVMVLYALIGHSLAAVTAERRRTFEALRTLNRDLAEEVEARVAELARVDQDLRASEERFRSMYEQATLGIAEAGTDGTLLRVNPGFARMLGYSAEELVGKNVFDLTHPDDRGRDAAEAERVVAGQADGYTIDKRYVGKDGRVVWARLSATAVRDVYGNIQFAVGMAQDITTEKQRAERIELLATASRDLLGPNDPSDLIGQTLLRAAALLRCPIFFHYSTEPCGTVLRLDHAAGVSAETRATFAQLEFGQALCGTTAAGRRRLVVPALQGISDPKAAGLRDLGARAYVCVPLLADDRVIGTLSFAATDRDRFDDEDIAFIETIGHSISLVQERLRVDREVRANAATLERYRLLSENARDIALFMRPDGRIVEANAAAVAVYGYTREELLTLSIADLRAEATLGDLAGQLQKALGEGATFDTIHRRRDGSTFPVEVSSRGTTVDGEPLLLSLVRDATERKAKDEALRESEERFRAFIETSPAMAFVKDEAGRYELVNRSWLAQFDPPVADWRGKTDADLWPDEISDQFADSDRACLEANRPIQLEESGTDRNGRVRHWLVTKFPLVANGHRFIGASVVDITDRKETEARVRASEEKFRQLAAAVPQAVWVIDADGRPTYVNDRWLRAFGAVSDEIRRTGSWDAVLHPDERAAIQDRWAVARARGEPVRFDCRLRMADGEYRWHDVTATPVRDPDGNIAQWYGTNIDIHDRRAAAEALRSVTDRLQHALVAARAGAWDYDLTTHTASWSPEMFALHGLDPSCPAPDLAAFEALIHEGDRDATRKTIQEAAARGGPFAFEFRVRRPDGQVTWIDSIGVVELGPDGTPLRARGIDQDITTRKTLEQARRDSDERFRRIVETANEGVWLIDTRGRSVFVNARLGEMLGYDSTAMVGRPVADFCFPEDVEAARARIAVNLAGKSDQFDFRFRRADGSEVHVLAATSPVADADGRPSGALGMFSDITARVLTERALRESEERFAKIFHASPSAMALNSLPDGQYLDVNDALLRVSGFDRTEVLGRTPLELGIFANPADQDRIIHRLMVDGAIPPSEVRLTSRDGRPRVSYMSCVRVDLGGDPCALTVSVDITEWRRAEEARRESDERFRVMADTVPSMIWTADASGNITYANQRWLDYTGLAEANRTSWPELVLHPDDYERCVSHWQTALASGADYEIEVRNRRHDGEYRWFVTRAYPQKDSDGRVRGWFGVTTDIHDSKLAQEALREADRRKDEFMALLGHELRNPLAPIRNALQVMAMAEANPEALRQTRLILDRQVKQMCRLVDDLLDMSRVTRGKIQLQLGRVNVADAVAQAVEASQPHCDAAGHVLTVHAPAEPVRVIGDSARLAQVFGNLLNNACKYTPSGGRIDVYIEPAGAEVAVRVVDSGVGIPTEMMSKVFDLFTQIDWHLDRAQGGLGIGLNLVRRLVEMHGGRVTVHSDGPGRGSAFTVTLPMAPRDAATANPMGG